MTNAWDPAKYLIFAEHRLRPAAELFGRVRVESVASIVDLGCGAGAVAPMLRSRWPQATYLGVDNSEEMLTPAVSEHPDADWLSADLATWRPDEPVDLLYSNAALHWLPGHETLLPPADGCPQPRWGSGSPDASEFRSADPDNDL